MNHLMRFFLAIFFLSVTVAFGQAGSIDTTFNAFLSTSEYKDQNGFSHFVSKIVCQPDGKLVIAGQLTKYNGEDSPGIIRINPDGTRDENFQYSYSGMEFIHNAVALQPDGKILIGSNAGVQYFENGPFGIARLNTDGSFDETFLCENGGFNSGEIKEIFVQDDGSIILTGTFSGYYTWEQSTGTASVGNIIRILPNGHLDENFNFTTAAIINSVVEQTDGKILVGGQYNSHCFLHRLNPDGSIDLDFFPVNPPSGEIWDIELVSDTNVLISGSFQQKVMLLMNDGSISTDFSAPTIEEGTIRQLLLQSDGKIVIGGSFTTGSETYSVARMNLDGSWDNTFSFVETNSYTPHNGYVSGFVFSDSNIIIGGGFLGVNDNPKNNIACVDSSGQLVDELFVVTGVNYPVYTTFVSQDDKILITGAFEYYQGFTRKYLARLNPDGSLDQSFDPQESFSAIGGIYDVKFQFDNKILISGEFQNYNGIARSGIIRLNVDGSVDESFDPGTGISVPIFGQTLAAERILVLDNGKILIAGNFNEYNGTPVTNIALLNHDGSLDNSFCNLNGPVLDMAIQPNGKILISGGFTSCNGTICNGFVRLNSNGTIDQTFNAAPNFTTKRMLLQPDGKIITIRDWAANPSTNGIRRLNPDGSVDNTFYSGFPADGALGGTLQHDGKIIVYGYFTNFYGQQSEYLIRLNNDGTIDPTFLTTNGLATGINASFCQLNSIALQTNGRIIIGGIFFDINGTPRNHLARLNNDITLAIVFSDIQDITCSTIGSVMAQCTNGVPPYQFSWSTGETNGLIFPDTAGVYYLTVNDAIGNTASAGILINSYGNPGSMDMKADLLTNEFRPGFPATTWLNAFNDGCVLATGQLKLVVDPLINFVSSTPTPNAIAGDTLIWNFIDLTYDSAHITPQIEFNTPETAAIGDTVHFTLIMTPISGDTDTTNNVKHYAFPVVNGYDPNDKAVYPVGKCDIGYIVPDQLLTYTIRFQNTGNSEAINIAVVDSLDTDLDLNSIHVIGKSHDMWTEVLPGNVLKFHFDNIHLADSTSNESESHGYVIFEAKPMAGLAHNTNISNKVAIYFDYNPAVVTNTVANTIYDAGNFEDYNCAAAGIGENDNLSLILFPNPTNGNVTIQSEKLNGASLTLIDLQGKTILQKSVVNVSETELDLEDLESGIYLLNVQAADKTFTTVRVVKQ